MEDRTDIMAEKKDKKKKSMIPIFAVLLIGAGIGLLMATSNSKGVSETNWNMETRKIQEYTLKELEDLLKELEDLQEFEQCAKIHNEIKRRKIINHQLPPTSSSTKT